MYKSSMVKIHNFIADYTDETGQHFNRCFQMMDLLTRANEVQAAKSLQEHLGSIGIAVYCILCIREKLTMEELQHVADCGELPNAEQGHMCIYPSPQYVKDMKDIKESPNNRYRGYFSGLM